METIIDISGVHTILGLVVEHDHSVHNPHSTICRHGATMEFILTNVLLEVGEYGGVCAVLRGETRSEEEVNLRLPLEGLKALLDGCAYARNTNCADDPESYVSETFEIIS